MDSRKPEELMNARANADGNEFAALVLAVDVMVDD
jgi:hypothetical protein